MSFVAFSNSEGFYERNYILLNKHLCCVSSYLFFLLICMSSFMFILTTEVSLNILVKVDFDNLHFSLNLIRLLWASLDFFFNIFSISVTDMLTLFVFIRFSWILCWFNLMLYLWNHSMLKKSNIVESED